MISPPFLRRVTGSHFQLTLKRYVYILLTPFTFTLFITIVMLKLGYGTDGKKSYITFLHLQQNHPKFSFTSSESTFAEI